MRIMNAGSLFVVAAGYFSLVAPQQTTAGIINVNLVSTTNNAYNDRAYFKNTGIIVSAGEMLQIVGSGQINVGGGHFVRTSFDMGMISPLNSSFLVRDYYGLGNNYTGTPVPLTGESVLFSQQRSSLGDQHDITITKPVLSDGYLYLGLFDSYFADNTGTHSFGVQFVPEPSALAILPLALVLYRRPRRHTNS